MLNLVIRNLCEVDPEKRSSCTDLFRWLKPYEESIINLEKFEVSSLPSKLSGMSNPQSVNSSPQRTFYGVSVQNDQHNDSREEPNMYRPQSQVPPPPMNVVNQPPLRQSQQQSQGQPQPQIIRSNVVIRHSTTANVSSSPSRAP